jgi:uncharacterized protein (TIGR02145 family)
MKPFERFVHRDKNYRHPFIPLTLMPALSAFVSFLFISCESFPKRKENALSDGLTEVQIGDQVWSARNFDGMTFRNGDSIPHVKSAEEWESAGKEAKPAWCYYLNDTSIGRKYGRIYNWFAVNDPRGFSPEGWHVPTNEEWISLEIFLGIAEAGLRLKCDPDWNSKVNGNNSSKFCALLGGYRGKEGGFSGSEEFTYLSSSSERDPKENDIWGRGIHVADRTIMRCGLNKEHGLYVRLIRD